MFCYGIWKLPQEEIVVQYPVQKWYLKVASLLPYAITLYKEVYLILLLCYYHYFVHYFAHISYRDGLFVLFLSQEKDGVILGRRHKSSIENRNRQG